MEGFLFQAKDYPIELCYRPPHGFVQVREALPSGASKTPLWPGTNPVLNIRTSNAVRTERLNGDFGPRSMSRLHSMVGNIAWQRWIGRGTSVTSVSRSRTAMMTEHTDFGVLMPLQKPSYAGWTWAVSLLTLYQRTVQSGNL